jgi:hypothetical protein
MLTEGTNLKVNTTICEYTKLTLALLFVIMYVTTYGHAVTRLRHYFTSRKVAGSISDEIIGCFN